MKENNNYFSDSNDDIDKNLNIDKAVNKSNIANNNNNNNHYNPEDKNKKKQSTKKISSQNEASLKKKGEFFCLGCNEFFKPVNNEVKIETSSLDELKIKMGTIILVGICPRCGKEIFQFSNISKLEELKRLYLIKPTTQEDRKVTGGYNG